MSRNGVRCLFPSYDFELGNQLIKTKIVLADLEQCNFMCRYKQKLEILNTQLLNLSVDTTNNNALPRLNARIKPLTYLLQQF